MSAGAPAAPGVVVVPDRPGRLPGVLEYVEELTMAGFAVDLVDLLGPVDPAGGSSTTDGARPDERDDAVPDVAVPDRSVPDRSVPDRSVPDRSVPEDAVLVAAAVTRLRDAGVGMVGAVGFARGGDLVLRAAGDGRIDAVVAYGAVGSVLDAARTACPVQLHLTATERPVGHGAAPGDVVAYVRALEHAGTPVDTFTYPGAVGAAGPHGRPDGRPDGSPVDPAAADAARARTIGFLHARLAR